MLSVMAARNPQPNPRLVLLSVLVLTGGPLEQAQARAGARAWGHAWAHAEGEGVVWRGAS